MTRSTTRSHRRLAAAVLVALAGAAGQGWPTPVAHAQDRGGAEEALPKELEEQLARLRNNPFFARMPQRVFEIVQQMLALENPRVDRSLRDLLLDTGTHPTVVEQIVIATWIEPQHRLLPDVVERLRIEAGSELDRQLELPILTYGDAALARRLVELAGDTARPTRFRATAVDLLGRNGDPMALEALLDLWAGPEKELREPAARAFERIVPTGGESYEQAVARVEEMRRTQMPFVEVLRRLLREQAARPHTAPVSGIDDEYVAMARDLLPRATLDQVLSLYLASPLAEIRSSGARRLVEFPYDLVQAPDSKIRAGKTCLAALRQEESEAVELDLLAALATLAKDLSGNVTDEALAPLLARLQPETRATNAVRLGVVKLLGELRETRARQALRDLHVRLGDGDGQFRITVLEAIQAIPFDAETTRWLIARLDEERNTPVVRKLVALLNRAEDPEAIGAFRKLLSSHPDQQVRWDVAKALGTLWASRQVMAARDALLELGLADSDPTVRRTSAAGLGQSGPGRDAVIDRLRRTVQTDVDAKVRQAAAKAILDLDPDSAMNHLLPFVAEDQEIWPLVRDHLTEEVKRRDKQPDRVLAAADLLAKAGHRRLAIDLLSHLAEPRDGLWADEAGRARVRERLVEVLLEHGDPAAAQKVALQLLQAAPANGDDARTRAEILLARSQCQSGRPDELRSARQRLEALRAAPKLPDRFRPQVAAELADCLLRLEEPSSALAVLTPVASAADLPAPLAERVRFLVGEARRAAEDERARVFALVEALDGPQRETSITELRRLGHRAAAHLIPALAETNDGARVRRLLGAAEQVAGRTLTALPADATPSDLQRAAGEARSVLQGVIDRAREAEASR